MLKGREQQREKETKGGREEGGALRDQRATDPLHFRLKMLNPRWSSCLWASLGVLLVCSVAGAHAHCWDSGWCRDMDTEVEMLECLKTCRLKLSEESPVYPGNGHLQPLSENIRKYIMSHFRWNKFSKADSNGSDLGPKKETLLDGQSSPGLLIPPSVQTQEIWEEDLENDPESIERQDGKRSYAMEHFRWGKPVGRKRRPIKVYLNGMKDESLEAKPQGKPSGSDLPVESLEGNTQEESSEVNPQEVRRDLSWEMDYPEFHSAEEKKDSEASLSDEEQPEESKKNKSPYQMGHFRWSAPPPPQAKKKRYGGFMTSERSHTPPLVTLFKNAIIKTAYKKGQ